MKKYISILLILFVLTTNTLAVTDIKEEKKDVMAQTIKEPEKDITALEQNETNQTNRTEATATPPISIPVITPTATPTPMPTESPGFEIVLTIVGILTIYVFGRKII